MDGLYARYAPPQSQESESWQQSRQIFTIYNLYRLVLALILLISFAIRSPTSPLGAVDPELFQNLCYFYIGLNLVSLGLPMLRMSPLVEALQSRAVG